MDTPAEKTIDSDRGAVHAALPAWIRAFGFASILVALATSALAGWYLNDVYRQLLRSELTMLFAGMSMPWNVIVPTIVSWTCLVGISMLVLLVGGIMAAAGSRRSRTVHLAAALLIFAATVGTCVALSVLVRHAGASPWPPVRYVIVAAIQSAWGWVIFFALGPRSRVETGPGDQTAVTAPNSSEYQAVGLTPAPVPERQKDQEQ